MRKLVQLLAIGLVAPGAAQAASQTDYIMDPDDGVYESKGLLSKMPGGFVPVPTIITEPAVGNGLAVTGLLFHESDEEAAARERGEGSVLPSNISLLGLGATDNGTKGGGIGHLGFWMDDRLRYKGFLLYGDLNLDFYSLGSIQLEHPVEMNLVGPFVFQQLTMRYRDSNWFAGVRQLYREVHTSYTGSRESNKVPPAAVDLVARYLERDITTSGLGLVAEYDSRNNPLGPTAGFNYVAHLSRYDKAIGSDLEYDALHLHGLNYWELSPRWDFAFRVQYDSVSGDSNLPPYVLPSVDLRGISSTRYQGEAVLVSEAELTWKWRPNWKFNLFAGLGRTADSFADIGSGSSSTNRGAGVRYQVLQQYGFWMGLDVAEGPEESAFYIQAGSAW